MQVAIHRVLVERDEHVDLVTHVAHGRIARANGQESVSAADDRLIGVVSVEMQPAPRENAGENVAGGGDALAVLAADADREIYFVVGCYHIGHLSKRELFAAAESNLGKREAPRDNSVTHRFMS